MCVSISLAGVPVVSAPLPLSHPPSFPHKHPHPHHHHLTHTHTQTQVRDGWPGKDPYIVATYDWGKEVRKTIGGLNEAEIEKVLKGLVEDGKSMPKYSDPPLNGTPKPIVDALPRDDFY